MTYFCYFRLLFYYFFVFLGFTTSLQLRETPIFVKKLKTVKSEIDNKTDKNEINSSEYEEIENGNNENYHFVLQPRAKLNFSSFIGSRLVGLLPILWMGLLINIPPWMTRGSSRKPLNIQVG